MFVEKKEDIKKKARIWRPFSQARAFVHTLRLKSVDEWRDYCKSGKKPLDIPSDPDNAYLSEYLDWGDWLGTGNVATGKREFRSFLEARAFVHSLRLQDIDEWYRYCKSCKKPTDIPTDPHRTYWLEFEGYGDWLGTGRLSTRNRHYRSFTEARASVRTLGLKSYKQWNVYCKSGEKPTDIPSHPHDVYN